jgi:biotin operon repressor
VTLTERVLSRLTDGRWRLLDGIAAELGVSRREAEAAIEELRLSGEPIIGGDRGVRLTDDPLELREYVQSRRHRALAIAKGTRQLRHTVNRLEGRAASQKTLWPA